MGEDVKDYVSRYWHIAMLSIALGGATGTGSYALGGASKDDIADAIEQHEGHIHDGAASTRDFAVLCANQQRIAQGLVAAGLIEPQTVICTNE